MSNVSDFSKMIPPSRSKNPVNLINPINPLGPINPINPINPIGQVLDQKTLKFFRCPTRHQDIIFPK